MHTGAESTGKCGGSSQVTQHCSDRLSYYLFYFTLGCSCYCPVQISMLSSSVSCSISALPKQEEHGSIQVFLRKKEFPEEEFPEEEQAGIKADEAQLCNFHTEYLSYPFTFCWKCSAMVETRAFNNALHLRNFPKINIDEKMQSFTLKKHS